MARAWIVLLLCLLSPFAQAQPRGAAPPYAGPGWIDTHVHLRGGRGSYAEALGVLVRAMDGAFMRRALLLPPPFPAEGALRYDAPELIAAMRPYSGRFGFLAGGGTLNPIIQGTPADKVTPQIAADFAARAETLLDQGARGFGEIAILHLSHFAGHPFEQVAADHPLILLLADMAARRGAVLDLHMDVVAEAGPLPSRFASPPNPRILAPNLPAFERLLAHNRAVKIVLAHAGWDVTGQWDVAISRRLLERHANLFMSLKLMQTGAPEHGPLMPGGIKPEWLALLADFPDRFVIGSDSFFAAPGSSGPANTIFFPRLVQALLSRLPSGLAESVAYGNAERIYALGSR